ncbi:MAG: IS30 family transposase [Candidatus Moraniibacteriota bacterium]|nr:MAG: IS30 family transposase [Candidatus Moranbacteria bacterium]
MNMPKGTSITFFERERIESFLRMKKRKHGSGETWKRLLRHQARDTKKFESAPSYVAIRAEAYAERRKKNTNKRKLEKWQNEKLKKFVESELLKGHSPEQIAGRLKTSPPKNLSSCTDTSISYESIYDYIYRGEGRVGGWYKHLRRKQKRRRPKFSRKPRKETIPDRIPIHERPAVITKRTHFGDWETDSVIFSKQKSVLSVQYERKMKLCRLKKVPNKTAVESERAIQGHFSRLPQQLRRSITRDNGTENVLHGETKQKLSLPSYFCDTYKSWQKGGVENLNGLLREYFPKKCPFDKISQKKFGQFRTNSTIDRGKRLTI